MATPSRGVETEPSGGGRARRGGRADPAGCFFFWGGEAFLVEFALGGGTLRARACARGLTPLRPPQHVASALLIRNPQGARC